MTVQVAPQLERRARTTESITQACGAAFVLYGVFLRVWLYFQKYSLNHDEAALALNLILFAVSAIGLAYASLSAAKNLLISPIALILDDPRGVLVEVKRLWHPGDKLYLSSGATPPFLYYQSRFGFSDDFVTGRVPSSFTWGPVFTTFPGARRVWFMYLPSLDGPFDRQAMQRAGKSGRELIFIDRGFYAAKLVEISNP